MRKTEKFGIEIPEYGDPADISVIGRAIEKLEASLTDIKGALNLGYNNTASKLLATNLQAVIDELYQKNTDAHNNIYTQLDNKVQKFEAIMTGDIKQLLSKPSGNYMIAPEVIGMPSNGTWWFAKSICNESNLCWIEVSQAFSSGYWHITHDNGIWRAWTKLATAEPPTKHSLLLNSKVEAYCDCYYAKNQFHEVTLNLSLKSVDGMPITDGSLVVATLPVGFRPKTGIEVPMVLMSSNGIKPCTVRVSISGAILIYEQLVPYTLAFANLSFIATA